MSKRHPHVVHESDLPWTELNQVFGRNLEASGFSARLKRLGAEAGGRKLGCTLHEVPAGKRAWPFHYHMANEEALYVLEGSGTLRIGEAEVPLRAGDYVALPPGGEAAHQVVNDSDAPLRYLAFSTMIDTELVVYPDSNKIGAASAVAPGVRFIFEQGSATDYWKGEAK